MLAVHGQHEQHGLADAAVQRQLVDDFGGHDELRRETAARWQEWRRAADDLEQLRAAQASRHQRLEIISFQLQEIEAAGQITITITISHQHPVALIALLEVLPGI